MMNTQPTRITEQLESILELLKRIDQEIIDRIVSLEQIFKKPKVNKYKYQSLINYLKDQGKENSDYIGTSRDTNKYLKSKEILVELQNLVQQEKQQKCLTKEDLENFLTKKPSKPINLTPPFRG